VGPVCWSESVAKPGRQYAWAVGSGSALLNTQSQKIALAATRKASRSEIVAGSTCVGASQARVATGGGTQVDACMDVGGGTDVGGGAAQPARVPNVRAAYARTADMPERSASRVPPEFDAKPSAHHVIGRPAHATVPPTHGA
jgi:hypothetical protein